MGVQISPILEKRELAWEEIPGKVAIDAYNSLYQFLSIIRQRDGTQLMDSRGRVTSHLSGVFYRSCNLLEKGITPVFVFDGKPPELKRKTILERKERKEEAERKLEEAREEEREEEIRVLAHQTTRLSGEMVEQAKKILELMGLPVVQAESEGEAECARLCSLGLVGAAASQDFDSLLFGASKLVRNLAISGRRKLPRKEVFVEVVPEEYSLEGNLAKLGISRRQLVWVGMLCGTDFNKGVYGIGPKKALKAVQGKNSLKEVLDSVGEKSDLSEVEELFLELPEKSGKRLLAQEGDLRQAQPRKEELLDFMVEEFEFSRERVENALNRAFKEPVGSRQKSLGDW
jgi:flap endonuclease-1